MSPKEYHLLFSRSAELLPTLPTSLLTSKVSISSAGNGRSRSIGLVCFLAGEPSIEVARVEDDGHAIVDRSHEFVRIGGDDRVALEPSTVRGVFPCVPQAGEGEHLAVRKVEGEEGVEAPGADRRLEVGLEELDHPVAVPVAVQKDDGHDLLRGAVVSPRRLAHEGTKAAADLLLVNPTFDPSEKDFAWPLAAYLRAQRAAHDEGWLTQNCRRSCPVIRSMTQPDHPHFAEQDSRSPLVVEFGMPLFQSIALLPRCEPGLSNRSYLCSE